MPNTLTLELKDMITKCLVALGNSLDTQIADQIHPTMINNTLIAYNGEMVKLYHLASIQLQDKATLSVALWDKHAVKSVEKSLQVSNKIGFTISCICLLYTSPSPRD